MDLWTPLGASAKGDVLPTPLERTTLRGYYVGMVFQGLWWAGYLLIPFILAKSLRAPGSLITVAVMMENLAMFLALYWGYLLARRGHLRVYLLVCGVCSRLIFLLTLLVRDAGQMVFLLAVAYVFSAMIYPAQNGIFQANFRPTLQGRYFGVATLIQNGVAVVASLGLGRLLDLHPQSFRLALALLGVAGFGYPLILSRLPTLPGTAPVASGSATAGELSRASASGPTAAPAGLPVGPFEPGRLWRGVTRPFREALATYRRDPAFRWFEINFMTYGAAFMCLMPIVPIFLTERLGLNYSEISTARVLMGQIGVALLGPAMGRLMDRYHPVRLCGLAFALFSLYPVALDLAGAGTLSNPIHLVYAAFGLYSVGMAGINVAWNVGSMAFAPPGQGGTYQGIHVAMVGIRGTVGPLVGFAVYELFGFRAVFCLAAGLLLAAALSSAALWRRLSERAAPPQPAAG